jgi:GTP-binding protein
VPRAYRRYLEKVFRRELKLIGTPVRIEFKTGENPFAGKRNVLSERQVERRRRLIQHVKKSTKKKS